MFPRLITRYGLATHLALLASLPFVLFPFLSTSRLAEVIFWLSGITFLWLVVEPSMRAGEHLSLARRRVFGALVRDVAFWFIIVLLVISYVRYLNSGVTADYSLLQGNVKSSGSYSDDVRRSVPSDPAKRRSWLDESGPDSGLRARAAAAVMLEEAFTGDASGTSPGSVERENAVLRSAKSRLVGATDHQAIVFARKLADLCPEMVR